MGSLKQISAEEFDAKFDAGEDMSDYVDWENGVMVQPGELSPGQKLSIVEGLLENLRNGYLPAKPLSSLVSNVTIPIPSLAWAEIGHKAARQHMRPEELVQSWIEEKLAEQKTAK